MKNLLFSIVCIVSLGVANTYAATVEPTSLKAWLRADDGVTGTTTITLWEDHNTVNGTFNATPTGATGTSPSLVINSMNFNPVIHFEGDGNKHLEISRPITDNLSMIAVIKTTQNAGDDTFWNSPGILGGETVGTARDYALGMSQGKLFLKTKNTDTGFLASPSTINDGNTKIVAGTRQVSDQSILYLQGKNIGSQTTGPIDYTNTTTLGIGNHADPTPNGPFAGDIAEIIIYDAVISDIDRQKIHSYLAVKYGVALNQDIETDYLDAHGNVVWDASAANGYIHRIFGIAKDEELDQRISKSTDNGIVTLSTDTDFTSANTSHSDTLMMGGYFLLSDNNGATTDFTSELDTTTYEKRIAREWKIAKNTSFSGNIHMKFEGFTNEYTLVKDADGDFSTGATELGTLSSTGTIHIDSSNLLHGEYLTLVKKLPPVPAVLINEVEYDSVQGGNDKNYEWIELLNTASGSIDLTGWTLSDNHDTYTFSSGTITSGQFYLIVNNTSKFQENYPSITPNLEIANVLNLSNASDYLELKNSFGQLVNRVEWENSGAGWDIEGTKKSICRTNIPSVLDTDTSSDWISNCKQTPGLINALNQPPTNITLSNNSIPENTTTVGSFTTTDADTGDTHTYTLVAGTGSDDNTQFTLTTTGGLSFSSAPDFENPSDSDSNNTYTIRVKTTDNGSPNLSFEKVFTITITDVNEAPTITDATFSVAENASNNTSVGTMIGSDVDASSTLTYGITAGNDDGIFTIDATTGEITVADNTNLDYETTISYSLTVQISDSILTDTATATIDITDVDDTSPICGNWTYSPTTWTNGTVTATLSDSTDETAITTTGGTCVLSSNSTTCDVIITDNAGNSTTCTSDTVTNIDKTSPVCGNDWTKTPATLTNGSVTMTLSGSADAESGLATSNNYTCSVSTNNSSCDIIILDNAGNSTTCTSSTVTNIDTEKPVITITAPTKISSGTITDTAITITDNTGIIASDIIATGGTIVCTQSGITTVNCTSTITTSGNLHITTTDQAGNTENKTENAYIIDTIKPVCGTWTYSPTTPTNGNVVVTLSGSTDTGGSGINIAGGTCTLTSNGSTCTVNISDNVGNTKTCTSGTVSNIGIPSSNSNNSSSTGPGGGYNSNSQPVITSSANPVQTDTSIQFLPTQSKAILDGTTPSGQKVFTIQNRVTDYVCPKIVQVYTTDEINAKDIKNTNFHDDIRALIMFRGLEKDETNLGQTFKEYQSYGVNLNTNGFRPYENITRAEYVKMLVRSLSCRYTFLGKDTSYTDIAQNDWHAEYIKFATEQGWINGYSDGTFKPNNPITRNEAAKIFSRAIRLQTASTIANPYLDVSEGSEFLPYIKSLRESGIMKGKTGNIFSPETYIPRTEASRMIYRTFLGGDI